MILGNHIDFNTLCEHRATCSKHVHGVHNVFHENRFAVLTDEMFILMVIVNLTTVFL